ncbi:MAG: hypothetical protein V4581_10775, partial [Bacteroidota bacterium]
ASRRSTTTERMRNKAARNVFSLIIVVTYPHNTLIYKPYTVGNFLSFRKISALFKGGFRKPAFNKVNLLHIKVAIVKHGGNHLIHRV